MDNPTLTWLFFSSEYLLENISNLTYGILLNVLLNHISFLDYSIAIIEAGNTVQHKLSQLLLGLRL